MRDGLGKMWLNNLMLLVYFRFECHLKHNKILYITNTVEYAHENFVPNVTSADVITNILI